MNIDLELFKIIYLLFNCDFDFSKEEEKIMNDFKSKLTEDEKSQLEEVLVSLDKIIDDGFESIQNEVVQLASDLKSELDDDLKSSYLNLVDVMIKADGIEHPNETILKREISNIW